MISLFFFFNDTATTEIYTLSLHDALPIYQTSGLQGYWQKDLELQEEKYRKESEKAQAEGQVRLRSEEHTSELQSRLHLVCRLLLEKKKNDKIHEKHHKE